MVAGLRCDDEGVDRTVGPANADNDDAAAIARNERVGATAADPSRAAGPSLSKRSNSGASLDLRQDPPGVQSVQVALSRCHQAGIVASSDTFGHQLSGLLARQRRESYLGFAWLIMPKCVHEPGGLVQLSDAWVVLEEPRATVLVDDRVGFVRMRPGGPLATIVERGTAARLATVSGTCRHQSLRPLLLGRSREVGSVPATVAVPPWLRSYPSLPEPSAARGRVSHSRKWDSTDRVRRCR